MDEIGKNFKVARTESGLNLEEVSNDTKIPKVALEQIEEGIKKTNGKYDIPNDKPEMFDEYDREIDKIVGGLE